MADFAWGRIVESFSIWHWAFILLFVLPAFLPLIIKPKPGPNRFTPLGEPKSFSGAISTCLQKYADFQGRASRSEYWWFYLFLILAQIAGAVVDWIVFGLHDGATELFQHVVTLALFLPLIAVTARRLHDVNRSGWWQLMSMSFGVFVLLYWTIRGPVDATASAEPPIA